MSVNNKFNQNGFIDPYVYTGLIFRYDEMIDRFGLTYYASRIAHIFLASLFYRQFGPDTGYFIHKIVMALTLGGSVFALARRYIFPAAALCIVAWALLTPWIMRGLLTDHYAGTAIIYTIAFITLLVIASRPRSFALSGMFFAFAVNCNPIILIVGGAFIPSWLVLQKRILAQIIKCMSFFLAGCIITYIVMGAMMYYYHPEFGIFFEETTIEYTWLLLSGEQTQYFNDLASLLHWNMWYIFTLPWILLILVTFYISKKTEVKTREISHLAILYIGLTSCIFFSSHWLLRAPYLGALDYAIYMVPALLLGLIALTATAFEILEPKKRLIYSGILYFLLLLGWILGKWLWVVAAWPLSISLLIAATAASATLIYLISNRLRASAAIIICLIAGWLPYATSEPYFRMLHDADQAIVERDVYHGAQALLATVGESAPVARGSVGFWYRNTPDEKLNATYSLPPRSPLDSMQSVYLWLYSRVVPNDRDVGMPKLDQSTIDQISRHRFLVLLGEQDEELNAGLASLKQIKRPFKVIKNGAYQGNKWGYKYSVVEFVPPYEPVGAEPALIQTIPLSQVVGQDLGYLKQSSDGLLLISDAQPGAFSATFRLKSLKADTNKALICIKLQVIQGLLGIYLTDLDDYTKLAWSGTAGVSANVFSVYVPAYNLKRDRQLILFNAASGFSTKAIITSIELRKWPEP